jgi:hypothetical protein
MGRVMIRIQPIDRSKPRFCCGTCRHWAAQHGDAYCPITRAVIPDQLRAVVCYAWMREEHESYAVALWRELGGYTNED